MFELDRDQSSRAMNQDGSFQGAETAYAEPGHALSPLPATSSRRQAGPAAGKPAAWLEHRLPVASLLGFDKHAAVGRERTGRPSLEVRALGLRAGLIPFFLESSLNLATRSLMVFARPH